MFLLIQLCTNALFLLVTVGVHADKVRVSRFGNGNGELERFLKKTKKSKAPVKMKKSNAPVASCSPCYTAADSNNFINAITNATNFVSTTGLVLNLCGGQTINIPGYGGTILTNPDNLPCKISKLTINCCGGLNNCGLQYTGTYRYYLDTIVDFASLDSYYNDFSSQVAMSVTLNGIVLSTSAIADAVDFFFSLPYTLSNCTNTVSGSFKAIGNIGNTFIFDTSTRG